MIETRVATLFVLNPDQQTPAEKAKVDAWRQAYTAFPQRFIIGSPQERTLADIAHEDSPEG